MKYRIFEKANPKAIVASADCEDDFTAETWAHKWIGSEADSDEYMLERGDGGFSAMLLRTVAGQWYLMRR